MTELPEDEMVRARGAVQGALTTIIDLAAINIISEAQAAHCDVLEELRAKQLAAVKLVTAIASKIVVQPKKSEQ